VAGRDDKQGETAGVFIIKEFKNKNVAILHDKSAFGKGVADETRSIFVAKATKKPCMKHTLQVKKIFLLLFLK